MDYKRIAKILRAEDVPLDGRDPMDIYFDRKEIANMKRAVCNLQLNSEDVQVILELLDNYPMPWEAPRRIAELIRKQLKNQEG